jgi:putative ABC transport system permease protein
MFPDLRYALRSLARSPGFAIVAALTIALGIGVNTTFFSVLYGVVLRGLPYPDAGALVQVSNLGPTLGSNNGQISLAELRDYRERQRTLAGIAAYDIGRVTLSRDDGAERVVQTRITANLLPLLGIAPALGRNFLDTEEHAGSDRVIIISHEFWQTHLAGVSHVLNRVIRLNGIEHTVIGVMPAGFSFGELGAAILKPLDLSPHGAADRADRSLSTVARLLPGVSIKRAQADLARIAQQLQVDLPADYPADAHWSLGLASLRQSQFGALLTPLAVLMSAATAVLLIACVNVAIMFLLRAAVRRRELTIRLAIGASRWHIVRQLVAESAVVCAVGAAGGMLFAMAGVAALKAFPPAEIPRLQEVAINGTVAAFTAGILILVTILVGLAPAMTIFKARVSEDIAHTGRSTESRAAVRLREVLTIVEIALAVTLLVCGGLAFRSLRGLLRDDVGFATARIFTFKTNLTAQAYPDLDHANRFYDELSARLQALPGVAAVAAVSYLPLSGESQFSSAAPAGNGQPATVAWRVVRGPYFSTLGSTLLAGRFFDATDRADAPQVAIVDDAFVRRFWPNEIAALGQPVRFGTGPSAQVRTIVGIVHHVKHLGPGKESLPEVYVPQAQFYQRGMYTVVKTNAAVDLVPLVRARLAEVDPTVPMYFIETMERRYANALAFPRFTAGLVGAFSALALILAGVGIFGVTAYSVAQRSREFGIRFALGAQRSHVIALVLGRVGRLALLGGVIGGFAAYELAQLMGSLLFGVEPTDTLTLMTAAAIVACTALTASLVPLVRALRVNPAEALRAE